MPGSGSISCQGVSGNYSRNKKNKKVLSVLLGRKEEIVFYLTMHSTHFIYGYMASDIW